MLKRLINRFKQIFEKDVQSVEDWKTAAQNALREKSFPVTEGLASLHRVEAAAMEPERTRVQAPHQGGYGRRSQEQMSVADLMEAVRAQMSASPIN